MHEQHFIQQNYDCLFVMMIITLSLSQEKKRIKLLNSQISVSKWQIPWIALFKYLFPKLLYLNDSPQIFSLQMTVPNSLSPNDCPNGLWCNQKIAVICACEQKERKRRERVRWRRRHRQISINRISWSSVILQSLRVVLILAWLSSDDKILLFENCLITSLNRIKLNVKKKF